MKKWTKLGIGLLCATLVTFGVRSISGVSNADEASQTVTGTVKTIDAAQGVTVSTDEGAEKTVPLSKMVWVFLDDQKAQMSDLGTGFKVELILNGKKQVAYIKAISITVTDKSGSAQEPATTASSAPAATSVTPAAGTSPTTSPAQVQTVAPTELADVAAPWKTLHIKIESNGFTMDIHDKGDHNNGMSMIKMKPKGRDELFLKGDYAEHWIRTLFVGIDLKAPNVQQQISTAFTNWFDLNGTTLNVNIEVEAKPVAAAAAATSASTPEAPSITPEAPVSTPASTSTASVAATTTVNAQITISQKNNNDDNENHDDNEDKQEHDKQKKDEHKKVELKIKEKEHQDNGKHKGKEGKDD